MQTEEQKHLKQLINAALIATRRGAFELTETPDIYAAVKFFTTPPDQRPEPEKSNHVLTPERADAVSDTPA